MSVRAKGAVYPYPLLDVIVLIHVALVHLLLRSNGLALGVGALVNTLSKVGPPLAASALAGLAVRAGWEWWHGRGREYLALLGRGRWLLSTARLLVGAILTSHFYLWLKLAVPLINARSYDQELWDLDRLLFFGVSPNELLVGSLSLPAFVRAMDLIYVIAFFVSVSIAIPLILAIPDDRRRFAYFIGHSALWIAGAWLYLLIPSLGPAYRFPDVWTEVYMLFRESRHLQYDLLQNYIRVTNFRDSGVLSSVNVAYGIAAFPSLHVGFQCFLMFWARRYSRALSWVLGLVVLAMFVGSILTGWHYAIDGIAGLLLAALCYRLGIRLAGRDDEDTRDGEAADLERD
jgi:hypothetical protein